MEELCDGSSLSCPEDAFAIDGDGDLGFDAVAIDDSTFETGVAGFKGIDNLTYRLAFYFDIVFSVGKFLH